MKDMAPLFQVHDLSRLNACCLCWISRFWSSKMYPWVWHPSLAMSQTAMRSSQVIRPMTKILKSLFIWAWATMRLLLTEVGVWSFRIEIHALLSSSDRIRFVCGHFLYWLSIRSCHFHSFFRAFLVQSTRGDHEIFSYLHHMNMSILNLNEFLFRNFYYQWWTITEPSLAKDGAMGSPWPSMGPLGTSWTSVNCTGVSVRAR